MKDSKASKKQLKGRPGENQRQARKDSKAGMRRRKAGKKRLKGRLGKTQRQARTDSKTDK